MKSQYEISMMGELTYFLGLQVKQVKEGIFINQTKYIYDYRGMVGSLLYLTASRPDIMFSTCLYARFQADPK